MKQKCGDIKSAISKRGKKNPLSASHAFEKKGSKKAGKLHLVSAKVLLHKLILTNVDDDTS